MASAGFGMPVNLFFRSSSEVLPPDLSVMLFILNKYKICKWWRKKKDIHHIFILKNRWVLTGEIRA